MADESNKQVDTATRRKLTTWIVAQSLIIITAVILSFLFVEVFSNFFFNEIEEPFSFYRILFRSGGTIIPMAIMLGVLNNFLSKVGGKYIGTMADALKEIADGNFSIRLNPKKAGPFSKVYTNVNKAAAELSNTEMLKTNFIDHYSHEFKTPITSIKGFAELLLEEHISPAQQQDYLHIIVEEATRLSEMTNTTILLSKLNAQEIIKDKKTYALDEQLRKCAILFLNEATQKDIQLDTHLEKCLYYGNEALMQHVWINLLNNAFKFTPNHGTISITLTSVDDDVLVEITDTGEGMTSDEADQIFNQYYQGKSDQSKKGLGLGLAIVKRTVDLNQGVVSVKSIKGEGTTFSVHLPTSS